MSLPPTDPGQPDAPIPQGEAPPAPEQAPAGTDWSRWEQAGWDPTQADPYEVREALRYRQAMADRNYRAAVLADTLQRGGELPEGWGYDQLREAIQEKMEREQAPDTSEFYDPQAGMFDPNAFLGQLPQIINHQVSQSLQQERARLEQDLAQRDMGNALWDLQRMHNLTDQDRAMVTPIAEAMRSQGVAPRDAVQQAWQNLQQWRASGQAAAVQQQAQAPQMGMPAGQTPAQHQGAPTSFGAAMDRAFGQQ